jgi:hypothetical protein
MLIHLRAQPWITQAVYETVDHLGYDFSLGLKSDVSAWTDQLYSPSRSLVKNTIAGHRLKQLTIEALPRRWGDGTMTNEPQHGSNLVSAVAMVLWTDFDGKIVQRSGITAIANVNEVMGLYQL